MHCRMLLTVACCSRIGVSDVKKFYSRLASHCSNYTAARRWLTTNTTTSTTPAATTSPSLTAAKAGDSVERDCSSSAKKMKVTFVRPNGEKLEAYGKEGDSLLDVAVDSQLPIDGFVACEGAVACSTCHVILKQKDYDKYPDKPQDDELDMLDLAYDLQDTSRLGCQILLSRYMGDGLEVELPVGLADARVN